MQHKHLASVSPPAPIPITGTENISLKDQPSEEGTASTKTIAVPASPRYQVMPELVPDHVPDFETASYVN